MMHTFPYKTGHIHVTYEDDSPAMRVSAQLSDGRIRPCKSVQAARKWITEQSRAPKRWATLEPQHDPNNPQLDFYGANDTWLYSSWEYKNQRHASAWLDRRRMSDIPVVAIRLGKQSK